MPKDSVNGELRLVSWNVAGLRACIKKGFHEAMGRLDPDIICLQEVKAFPNQVTLNLPDYHAYWNPAVKAGYSGTLLLTKEEPIAVVTEFGVGDARNEGRVIIAEYPKFYLVTCYTPNSKEGLTRLDLRMQWEDEMRRLLLNLDKWKPVIYCGDLNVAHNEIDIARPDSNRQSPGFSKEERTKMTLLLSLGFVDTFRAQHPNDAGCYTYWSYFGRARDNNVGWRLDYFIVSERFMPSVEWSWTYPSVMGSDHCPIGLDIILPGD